MISDDLRSLERQRERERESTDYGLLELNDFAFLPPQYCFDITDDDQQLVVQLSQPDVRERRREGAQNLIIGLHVLKVRRFLFFLFFF